MAIRVLMYGLGPIGAAVARQIVSRKGFQIVGAVDIDRAKIGLKASIIMSGESTSGRAGAIAHDYFMRGRIRTLDEISSALDAVSVEQVNGYLKKNEPGPFTVVIVGPKELKLPS